MVELTMQYERFIPSVYSFLQREFESYSQKYGKAYADLVEVYTMENMYESIENKSSYRYRFRADNGVRGVLIENACDDSFDNTIRWIFANPSGCGVGSNLIRESLWYARNENMQSVSVYVEDTNLRARKLYEYLGFESVSKNHMMFPIHKLDKSYNLICRYEY